MSRDQSTFPLSQHTKHVDCPKEKRENLIKHNAIKHTTAYKSDQSSSVPLDISDTKLLENIRSTALWMLIQRKKGYGRGNLLPSWVHIVTVKIEISQQHRVWNSMQEAIMVLFSQN